MTERSIRSAAETKEGVVMQDTHEELSNNPAYNEHTDSIKQSRFCSKCARAERYDSYYKHQKSINQDCALLSS